MITLEDCIALCGLTEEEVLALAEHEHIPEIAAAALAQYLLNQPHGADTIRDMIRDDIKMALRQGRRHAHGRVLKVLVTSEQVVLIGTPLVEIGNPATQEIIVDLLSTDAVKVREGAAAVIDGWGDNRSLPAQVRRIESAGFTKVSALGIEEQRVRVVLDFTPPNGQHARLGHEFRVFVRIRVWEAEDVVRVPVGALFRQDGRWSVFKRQGTRVQLNAIEIGHRNSEMAVVVDGLAHGDRVVLHPSDRVASGVRTVERVTNAN